MNIVQTNNVIMLSAAVLAALSLTACGGASVPASEAANPTALPIVGEADTTGVVIKSRASFTISTDKASFAQKIFNQIFPIAYAASGSQAVTVVNAPNVSMTLDSSQWLLPAITNAVLDFGNLTISALQDNNLSVCGANGKQKCNNAVIRVYTTGQSGAGMWNSAEGYGMPMTAGLVNNASSTVGLEIANAVTVQTQAISNGTHVLRQSDFTTQPKYNVKSDFTNAGAGSYSTTIVIDYGVSL